MSADHDQHDHGHGHDSHDDHEGGSHGSLRDYTIGFLLSVVLTAIPFWLVMSGTLGTTATTILITAAAVFHACGRTEVAEIGEAHELLAPMVGSAQPPVIGLT